MKILTAREMKEIDRIAIEEIGIPGAARAVGNAAGKNPVPIIVPCHRLIAAQGKLGGFTGGMGYDQANAAIGGDDMAALNQDLAELGYLSGMSDIFGGTGFQPSPDMTPSQGDYSNYYDEGP